jgi:hypothetical protein
MFPCLSKTLFGIECLGCGFQRALVLLFRAEFVAAFKMYPAIYTTLFMFFCIAIYYKTKLIYFKKILNIAIFTNVLFMITGYCFKHFL